MKIDEMIRREDFFSVLLTTLNRYFEEENSIHTFSYTPGEGFVTFYIYPRLNSIFTAHPSKDVKGFIKSEYRVGGSLTRRLLVWLYIRMVFLCNGIFSHKIKLYASGFSNENASNILIYPCNKKIRIFDFECQTISVILKNGFPRNSIDNEIRFRKQNRCDNVEPILYSGKSYYKEKVIKGRPLARIQKDRVSYRDLKILAMKRLHDLSKPYDEKIKSDAFVKKLIVKINAIADNCSFLSNQTKSGIQNLGRTLADRLSNFKQEIIVTLSHGDFHHGNIWIENDTRRVIFIDWETAGTRYNWYDTAVLFGGLREVDGAKKLLEDFENDMSMHFFQLMEKPLQIEKLLLIILEDLLFRVSELERVPSQMIENEIKYYCEKLLKALTE